MLIAIIVILVCVTAIILGIKINKDFQVIKENLEETGRVLDEANINLWGAMGALDVAEGKELFADIEEKIRKEGYREDLIPSLAQAYRKSYGIKKQQLIEIGRQEKPSS